jgi:protein-L-isoaspartate(D-aspartate) O-methyltransferase
MSADRLTQAAAKPPTIETAVLAVLAGSTSVDAAARHGVPAELLTAAVDLYRAAGRTALEDWTVQDGWHQIQIDFADWRAAEQIAAARLGPLLAHAEADGIIMRWFFTRKGATWRLRCQSATEPLAGDRRETVAGWLDHILRTLAKRNHITAWSPSVYEAETHAFGGRGAMEQAHRLFHADSAAILQHLASPVTLIHRSRAELSTLLCGRLLKGAGQDWYEQGDIWARVAAHRAPAIGTEPDHQQVRARIRRLLTADTSLGAALLTRRPLAPYASWAAAFDHAGEALRRLSDEGTLTRGLRAVLAHHILFHWNRIGLPSGVQGTLAAAARNVVLHHSDEPVFNATASAFAARLPEMENPTVDQATTSPQHDDRHLRNALVDQLRDRGTLRSSQIEEAMRAVPRHLFLPEVSLPDAYAITQIVTKTDAGGQALSSVSHPGVVAGMLEQLDVKPGHRVLEIGSGGYNAALLTHLVGPDGHVTTLDIDPDVIARAQRCLTAAGYHSVEVVTADGEYGHPAGAPYDRLIVTVGAWDLPPAWFDQLNKSTGRLVVPLRIRAQSRIVTLAATDGRWRSQAIEYAGFVPMRGDGAHASQVIPLTPDGEVELHTDDPADAPKLAEALTHPVFETWTGITIPNGTSYEHLDLWLTGMHGASRLTATANAIDRGVVHPTFGWGATAVHDGGGTIAYLIERPATTETDNEGNQRGVAEIGIRAHGPAGAELADSLADQVRIFDREHRRRHRAVIEVRPRDVAAPPDGGTVITKRHTQLILTWE